MGYGPWDAIWVFYNKGYGTALANPFAIPNIELTNRDNIQGGIDTNTMDVPDQVDVLN